MQANNYKIQVDTFIPGGIYIIPKTKSKIVMIVYYTGTLESLDLICDQISIFYEY